MMQNKYDRMLDQFRTYYPDLYDQAVDWWPSGRMHISIKTDDRLIFEYSSLDNTIRRVKVSDYSNDPDALKKGLGRNLQKVMLTRTMSQSQLAEKIGVTQAMLSRYIHGTSMPGLDKLYSIASVLGCRVADLLDDTYED